MFEKYGHPVVLVLSFAFLSWAVSYAVPGLLFQQLHFTPRGAMIAGIWIVFLTIPLLFLTPLLISCILLAVLGVGINEAGIRASEWQGAALPNYANANLMLVSIIYLASIKSNSERWWRNSRRWPWQQRKPS